MLIPVFPLAIFLLPQGVTRLRIFEQRYLHLVKVASKEHGFAILFTGKSDTNTDSRLASWVEIINFDSTDEGILQIDVKCKGLIALKKTYTDELRLMWADGESAGHWPVQQHNEVTLLLSELLQSFFQQNTELFELYQQNFVNQPNWVMARWLELLPLKNKDKAHFLLPDSFPQAISFLAELLLEKKLT